MELTPEIRERLKTLMESRKETGYTLNRKLGISATTIGNYLNGKITKADNTKIKAMCDLWGVDMKWLETGLHTVQSAEEINPENENPEQLLKQILLRLEGKDDQYALISQDIRLIKDNLSTIYKNLNRLIEELQHLQANRKASK
ncbi:MAG: helix-turn-helix domain-containing protein [Odoribacter sp.]|nr:helix-turn-helix domain-containing protein [Odoribacter sp.]